MKQTNPALPCGMTRLAVAIGLKRLEAQFIEENREKRRVVEGFLLKMALENTELALKS